MHTQPVAVTLLITCPAQVSLESVEVDITLTGCTTEKVARALRYIQEEHSMHGTLEQHGTTFVVNGSLVLLNPVIKEGVTGKAGWKRWEGRLLQHLRGVLQHRAATPS